MFASLVGTNTESTQCESIFERLCEVAVRLGFSPGDTRLPIQRDQLSLDGWSLTLRGPATGEADFLLAVTAPKVPGISPIPVKKTVSGPLFAVVVMATSIGVWHDGAGDFAEFKEVAEVLAVFEEFLRRLSFRGENHV